MVMGGNAMEIDRRAFIASLGGSAAVGLMSHEARADALEDYMLERLDETAGGQQYQNTGDYPTVAELKARIETRSYRRGVGRMFVARNGENVKLLEPMPEKPTLVDFFKYRWAPANHVLQSATRAMKTGMPEEVTLACLLHDVIQGLMVADHGFWGAQMFEPYVPPETSWAIRYHQPLRFFADEEAGYEYPESYLRTFGVDYEPIPHIQAAYDYARNHKWYMNSRLVTVNDLYSFDRSAVVTIDPFIDLIGRLFKQPKEGLGNDNSPVAHMWRTIIMPDSPL